MKVAEEICKIILKRQEDKDAGRLCGGRWNGKDHSKKEEERKKNIMKERKKLRIWDLGWGNLTRVQIAGDPNLVVHWLYGRWNINNQKVKS